MDNDRLLRTNLQLLVPDPTQRFVSYFRVSTERQGRSGLEIDAQRLAVETYLRGKPAMVVAEFLEIESGRKDERPKLKEALDLCRKVKAKLLLAKLDRLARSVSFVSGLMDTNTEFVAVDMPHASRFVLHIMAAVAEHERQLISERTRAALAVAKSRGVVLGRNGANLAATNRASAISFARSVEPYLLSARQAGALTTRDVAAFFEQSGLKPREGGRWHAASVARIIQRLGSSHGNYSQVPFA